MTIVCTNTTKIDFNYKKVENCILLEYAKNKLPLEGILKLNETDFYYYLKVHDDFIFELFPLITEPNLSMPDYFPPKYNTGAHVSVIYPEEISPENINLKIDELEKSFSFEVADFFSLSVFNKTFFALTVYSPALEQLRLKYGPPPKLSYHGLLVPFHITIATQNDINI